MDVLFPFGFPAPTAAYLALYVLTLIIHVLFMNYVLAGSAYLAVETVMRRRTDDESPLAAVLREWLPFILSAAITAGIAPLLFLQILYQRRFYTANLLLFHRWMAILPALIGGFYLLYLLKSRFVRGRPAAVRAAIGVGAFTCFAFVGWSWTENHLLSLQPPEAWIEHFASRAMLFRTQELLPRLALWFVGAFPTMAVLLGWQLWYPHRNTPSAPVPGSKRTAAIALAAILMTVVAAVVYSDALPEYTRKPVTGAMAGPYLMLAVAGLAVQFAAWFFQFRRGRLTFGGLATASAGLASTLVGTAVVREAVRISSIDIESLYERHARLAEVGGVYVFAAFFAINVALIGYCLRLVRRGTSDTV